MMIEVVRKFEIKIYSPSTGKSFFIDWIENLDSKTRARVKERLDRIALGNLGDWKQVGQGVSELRFSFGPGYRIYFGKIDKQIILLISGGDKTTQKRDIKLAQHLWKNYLREDL